MRNAVSENRSPVFVPLTLALLVLMLSGAFVLIGTITAPAQAGPSPAAEFLQWLGSIGALIGFVLAVSCVLVDRRGVPVRAWATILAALVLIFGLGVLWSLAQGQALAALLESQDRQALLAWAVASGALKVVVVNAVALPLAFRLGGRGDTPVLWQPWQRRVIGALVAFAFCAGVSLLLQNIAASFNALGGGEQRLGMSVVALGVGAVHGLFALALPMRRGSGAMPALLSSLLTPGLIVAASLPVVTVGMGWDIVTQIVAVLLILLIAPMLSWLLVRWLHARRARA